MLTLLALERLRNNADRELCGCRIRGVKVFKICV